MTYKDRLKTIIGNDDPYWFEVIDEFINEYFDDKEFGIVQVENFAKDRERFNEFTRKLNSGNDEAAILFFDLSVKYSQDELKGFFYHQMTESEFEKINSLELNDIISKIQTSTYKLKYIDNVGYISIGEGYTIFYDGTTSTRYFAKIFNSDSIFKKNLLSLYNKKINN